MRLSRDFFYTLREDVRDEDSASGNLLTRAGMIRRVAAGVYMMLPLGLRAMEKIEAIIREEMVRAGSVELRMPALIPEDVYIASGRREAFGASMFALRDRGGRPFVLGPTHEELFAVAARQAIHSYKDLPLSLFQFQTKYRDEPRPRFGLIRVREFVMKDAYSFDLDLEGLGRSYQAMFDAYKRAFDRMEIDYAIVTADTGAMGGLLSEEFQALCPIGEDILVMNEETGYAANLEVAACPRPEPSSEEHRAPRKVPTPGQKTIEDVTRFFGETAERFVKTLIYLADGRPAAFLVRGDHEISEVKAMKLAGCHELEMAPPEVVEEVTRAPVGFAGPIGLEIPVYADYSIMAMANMITGGNEADMHIVDVNLEDFSVTASGDIRQIHEGETTPESGGPVHFRRGIEIGNTFKLGEKYSMAMDLFYTDSDNQRRPVVMGSYGIGPGACLAAIVEQNHADGRIFWPRAVAPIEVAIVVVSTKNETQVAVAEGLYESFQQAGYDVLLDDRDERAGIKFNDMDLIGAWLRVTVGRGVAEGKVELKLASSDEVEEVAIADAPARVAELLGR